MKIKKTIERVPGGMMIIPLFLGVIVNTIAPGILNIGGLFTAMAHGTNPLIGAFLLCMGACIHFKSVPKAIKKGVAVTAVNFFVGALLGILVAKVFGDKGFLGLSGLAIIAATINN